MDEYESLLTNNEIFRERTIGVGVITRERAFELDLTGPSLRACGVDWDLRKLAPYSGYETYDFDVPTLTGGDVYDRYLRADRRDAREQQDRAPGARPPAPRGRS